VNGNPAQLGQSADPATDEITVDGRPIGGALALEYIALNKPAGYACTRHDPHLPRTVYELLPPEFDALFTVGRLDVDTEGLLLLTNDGDWSQGVTHPRRHVPKTYIAEVRGYASRELVHALRQGIELEDGKTLPARVDVLWERPGRARLEVILTEGRKRQVRRMLQAVGLRVETLTRVQVGPIRLGDLPVGRWRTLSRAEVSAVAREARA
jgi:pseudouridine synthase